LPQRVLVRSAAAPIIGSVKALTILMMNIIDAAAPAVSPNTSV
jgi:hypothetical protein